jgi:trehalose/maltose hydrolase-like predicted phosphorylase
VLGSEAKAGRPGRQGTCTALPSLRPITNMWLVTKDSFNPHQLHQTETIFTLGNGYLSTRGALEEGYPNDHRATFIHGVFDAAPIGVTELANAPDWLPLTVHLNGERFSMDSGMVESSQHVLDLRTGVLTRTVHWRTPSGLRARLTFERFASLVNEHLLLLRCSVTLESAGTVEFRAGLNGSMDNKGFAHWCWRGQGRRDDVAYLRNRTRQSGIELVSALSLRLSAERELWDVENAPTWVARVEATPGQTVTMEKIVAIYTSRDAEAATLVDKAVNAVNACAGWESAHRANVEAWAEEWAHTDVIIEGDDEAQLALRFNLFQMLIAAPRHDERVNIGAKTLSGFGYRGHAFWDTEIFMLPLFTYTAPHIAKNLLNYRYNTLPAARAKAKANGFAGAQFAWESADTGEEVTPPWLPHFADKTKVIRILHGDHEIHVSADVAYAAHQYWQLTSDNAWFIDKGAELILDTAHFWAARAEWNAERNAYEYNDVIGPEGHHIHVNNNAFTNRMAQWNLQAALDTFAWLSRQAPVKAAALSHQLQLDSHTLSHWRDVIEKMYVPVASDGLIEQFEGYFQHKDIDLAALEPRSLPADVYLGVESIAETQIIKQPDVLMLQYLLRDYYSAEAVRVNYAYYNPRTDHTYGSSLGPAIMAIIACWTGDSDEAYEHFIRAARADLHDVRGNADDGIHAASAGATWQSVVFGFAGLRLTAEGWTVNPRLPKHWKRLAFKFYQQGQLQDVNIQGN